MNVIEVEDNIIDSINKGFSPQKYFIFVGKLELPLGRCDIKTENKYTFLRINEIRYKLINDLSIEDAKLLEFDSLYSLLESLKPEVNELNINNTIVTILDIEPANLVKGFDL